MADDKKPGVAKAKAKAKTKTKSKAKAPAKTKAKATAKPKTKPKAKASAKSKAKPSGKSKPATKKATAKRIDSRNDVGPGVPAAVAATLANAQEQLAALNEAPARVPERPVTTAQLEAVSPSSPPLATTAPLPNTSAFERMPVAFWPAINTLCDRPEAVREAYRHGHDGPGTLQTFLGVILLASGAYGLSMGATNALQGVEGHTAMALVTAIKLPILLLAVYAFAFAPLYLAARFLGYAFTSAQAARLLLASTSVTAVTLAGAIPIAVLFAATTATYPVMQLLHGVLLAIAGFMGALFFTTRCHAIHGRHATLRPLTLMFIYIVLHLLIATQWAFVTGPYIGDPESPFALLRVQGASWLEALL